MELDDDQLRERFLRFCVDLAETPPELPIPLEVLMGFLAGIAFARQFPTFAEVLLGTGPASGPEQIARDAAEMIFGGRPERV